MKRPPDKRTNDTLPSYLDESTVENETHASDSQEEETGVLEQPDEPAEGELVEGQEDADATEAEAPEPAHEERAAQPAADTEAPAREVAGVVVMLLGAALVVGSSVLIAMERTLPGFSPQSLMLLGAVLFATSVTHRRIAAMHRHHAAAENRHSVDNEALLQMLLSLQSAHMDREGGTPLAGEEFKYVSLAMQRQDEKINNLTKALKMYGKPLMEITGQGAELAGSLALVRTAVDAGEEAARETLTRLEQLVRTLEAQKPANSSELNAALTKAAAKIASLDDKSDRALEPLQKQLGRLEAAVVAALQKFENKLENGDSGKRLQRIEEATKKAREDVQELLRGGSVEKAASQLQERLDKATSRLSDGLQKMRDGNLHELESQIREVQREISSLTKSVAQMASEGAKKRDGNLDGLETQVRDVQREVSGIAKSVAQIQASEGQKSRDVDLTGLETQVRDVQREISGLARSVAQIQASVKNGAPRAEAPGSSYVGPAPTPAREPAPGPSLATSAAPAANGAAAEYQTGKRSTASKNVLGAIAKLKQMKG